MSLVREQLEAAADAVAEGALEGLGESAKTAGYAVKHAPIGSKSNGKNWIERDKPSGGQLPAYIQNVRNALIRDGMEKGRAHAVAISRIETWKSGGGNVSPEVRAAAAKAWAQWEAMKARAGKLREGVRPFDYGEHPRDALGRFRDKVEALQPGQTERIGGVLIKREPLHVGRDLYQVDGRTVAGIERAGTIGIDKSTRSRRPDSLGGQSSLSPSVYVGNRKSDFALDAPLLGLGARDGDTTTSRRKRAVSTGRHGDAALARRVARNG